MREPVSISVGPGVSVGITAATVAATLARTMASMSGVGSGDGDGNGVAVPDTCVGAGVSVGTWVGGTEPDAHPIRTAPMTMRIVSGVQEAGGRKSEVFCLRNLVPP